MFFGLKIKAFKDDFWRCIQDFLNVATKHDEGPKSSPSEQKRKCRQCLKSLSSVSHGPRCPREHHLMDLDSTTFQGMEVDWKPHVALEHISTGLVSLCCPSSPFVSCIQTTPANIYLLVLMVCRFYCWLQSGTENQPGMGLLDALQEGLIAQGLLGALTSPALSTPLDQRLDQGISCVTERKRT